MCSPQRIICVEQQQQHDIVHDVCKSICRTFIVHRTSYVVCTLRLSAYAPAHSPVHWLINAKLSISLSTLVLPPRLLPYKHNMKRDDVFSHKTSWHCCTSIYNLHLSLAWWLARQRAQQNDQKHVWYMYTHMTMWHMYLRAEEMEAERCGYDAMSPHKLHHSECTLVCGFAWWLCTSCAFLCGVNITERTCVSVSLYSAKYRSTLHNIWRSEFYCMCSRWQSAAFAHFHLYGWMAWRIWNTALQPCEEGLASVQCHWHSTFLSPDAWHILHRTVKTYPIINFTPLTTF